MKKATWRAYVELMRLSNLPTVWSNALVGLYAGHAAAVAGGILPPAPDDLTLLRALLNEGFVAVAALSGLYAGGMVLNDVLDRQVDTAERPGRPLPSGRVTPEAARRLAWLLLLAGVVLLGVYRPPVFVFGLLLAGCIVAYNRHHRASAAFAGVMGLCRALVYIVPAAMFVAPAGAMWRVLLPVAGVMFIYITLVSLIARAEVSTAPGRVKWAAPLMIPVAMSPALFIWPVNDGRWLWVLAIGGLMVVWLSRGTLHALASPPRTPQAVMTWLSGICLADAYFLALLGHPGPAGLAIVCWAMTGWGHRRVAGT